MVKFVTSDNKIFSTKDILKHLLCNIGQDIEGNFNPNHADFYVCFGTWHTEKGGIYIAIFVTILFVLDIISTIILRVWYMLPFALLIFPIEALLIYGIKKEKSKFILPHLILSVLMCTLAFLILICTCIAAITPNVFFYNIVTPVYRTSNTDTKMVWLLFVLTVSITLILLFWITWSLYFHYQYLRGLENFIKKRSEITV